MSCSSASRRVASDLQPDGAGLDDALGRGRVLRARARLQTEVHRDALERLVEPCHVGRRLLEPGGDQRGHAGRQCRRHQLGRDEVHVAVDRAGGRDQAVAHDRKRVRPDGEIDAGRDVGVAGTPDAHHSAVLDADVGLDDPQQRVDDERARDQHVELAVGRRAVVLRHPGPDVLRVPPQRFVAVPDVVALDAKPQIGVAEADAIPRRRPVASRVLGAGQLSHGREERRA
jgi:hypothetical protein